MVNTENLQAAFLPFGEITDVSIPWVPSFLHHPSTHIMELTWMDRKNDAPNSMEPHRGFGYVEFENAEDVKDAIDNMDQSELFGKVIKVSAAKPPKNVNEGLGSKTALWEQVCCISFKRWYHGFVLIFQLRRAGLRRMQ